MDPVTPTSLVRPQESSHRRPLTAEEEAKKASVARIYQPRRPTPNFKLKRQAKLQNEVVSLHVTKSTLLQPEGKVGGVSRTNDAERVVDESRPRNTHQSQLTQARSQLQTPLSKVESSSGAKISFTSAVADSPRVSNEPLHHYQWTGRREAQKTRDIYRLPEDDPSDEQTLFQEPRTSSFRYPSEDPAFAPSSLAGETLEQCLRRRHDTSSAPIDEPQHRNTSPASTNFAEQGDDVVGIEGAEPNIDSENELDDVDVMLLGLDLAEDHVPGPSVLSLSSTKRPRATPREETPNFHQMQNDGEHESEQETETPLLKRRKRSNRRKRVQERHSEILKALTSRRQAKSARKLFQKTSAPRKSQASKKLRRLPVGELVTISQQLDESDLDFPDSPPLEVSQDPVSQLSEDESESGHHRKHIVKSKITKRRHKGLGLIDTSQFRLPKPLSPRSRSDYLRTPSYSDGFEGREATPIGRTMPIRRPAYRKEAVHRIAVRLSELTLVTEKPSLPSKSTRSHYRKKNELQSAVHSQAQPDIVNAQIEVQASTPLAKDESIALEPQSQQATGQENFWPQIEPEEAIEVITEEQLEKAIEEEEELEREYEGALQPSIEGKEDDQTIVADQHLPGGTLNNLPNENLPNLILPELVTPGVCSNYEPTSAQYASTTSPLKRKLQNEVLDTTRIKASTMPIIHTVAEKRHKVAHSQFDHTISTPKTLKQAKADMEAMYELSMVSLRKYQVSDDDGSRDDSECDELEGDGRRHRSDGSPWTASDVEHENENEEEEPASQEIGPTMVIKQESDLSPVESTPSLPTLTEESSTPSRSLNALTRKASAGMGTLPASASRRTMSMPWKPPFKNAWKMHERAEA
ncbi:uncharacterized protein LY89DRAFT_80611 [Mollisia scopiformis]|uniref:Uncharacterized protein n=1 Tax=Mollisia scopiformis TaxID=149040 RepID=A0A194X857_MOLSC|nr:uncharacterized protein LY89DRAFT_80611 [Mollisia scopiformis]KUJ16351.1 hypothetical protein LY89DRAFT_80611 [Mollisia scopiformis]